MQISDARSPHNPKLLGERAECAFLLAALERSLAVSKPWGDSSAYDAIVDNGRRLLRVQVRSASKLSGRKFFVSAVRGYSDRPLTPADRCPRRLRHSLPCLVPHPRPRLLAHASPLPVHPHPQQPRTLGTLPRSLAPAALALSGSATLEFLRRAGRARNHSCMEPAA